ncbi:MAG: D-amino acid aminotransferase [Betaproteobacteria bacterium]|nr:D-amino acid aminotransferase [Betaproteobacteria bacterium]
MTPLAAAKISVMDRGFLFGDGVYEVVPAYCRRLFCWRRHMRRLSENLDKIQIAADIGALTEPANALINAAADADSALYIQITRGAAAVRRHAFPAPPPPPTVFMMAMALPPRAEEKYRDGVACRTMEEFRWNRADIKSVSLLGGVLAAQFAAETGGEEVILIRDGWAGEAAASNIFAVADGILLTPPADCRILPGISREIVLEIARRQNIKIQERDIARAELGAADEIWLTSSTREIMPVAALDGAPVGGGKPGKMFAKMSAAFRRFIEDGEE